MLTWTMTSSSNCNFAYLDIYKPFFRFLILPHRASTLIGLSMVGRFSLDMRCTTLYAHSRQCMSLLDKVHMNDMQQCRRNFPCVDNLSVLKTRAMKEVAKSYLEQVEQFRTIDAFSLALCTCIIEYYTFTYNFVILLL